MFRLFLPAIAYWCCTTNIELRMKVLAPLWKYHFFCKYFPGAVRIMQCFQTSQLYFGCMHAFALHTETRLFRRIQKLPGSKLLAPLTLIVSCLHIFLQQAVIWPYKSQVKLLQCSWACFLVWAECFILFSLISDVKCNDATSLSPSVPLLLHCSYFFTVGISAHLFFSQ